MSDLPIRFLHAADFQLDQPPYGLTEIPDHLRDVLVDSPYRAAERVFDTAISEKVAFVCLAGDLLDLSQPSARSLAFLHEQLHRLEEAGISVFWSAQQPDIAPSWPAAIPLPDSVRCFSSAVVESHHFTDAAGFAIRVIGRSGLTDISASEFLGSDSGQYTLAVASGKARGQSLAKRNIDYWALGGQLDRKTLFSEPQVAHYSGTPQGRSPHDIGPHGCTLVEVRRPRETRLRFIPCDVMRWQHERVLVSAAATWSDLQELLAQRVGELRSQTPTIPLLARWTFSAADSSVDAQRLQSIAGKASGWLKKQFGYQSEPCWPVAVNVDVHDRIPPASYEEDTLLGDYLRAVRAMQEDERQAVLESPCLPQQLPDDLSWLADLSDAKVRAEVLREAASVGAALLRGERAI